MVVISDFKDEPSPAGPASGIFGAQPSPRSNGVDRLGADLDEQVLAPEEIQDHARKDEYLKRYNGVMVTAENMCVQSEFTYRPNHVNYFEINDSLAQFNLFRFSRMTSKDLFYIRHPCFGAVRKAQHDKSLDHYSRFCTFFELSESRELRASTQSKMLQGYKLPPVELQEEEMAITDNMFFKNQYGTTAADKINYNSSLTYKQMLGGFKTLFPRYVLTNEHIQRQIQTMTYGHRASRPIDFNLRNPRGGGASILDPGLSAVEAAESTLPLQLSS
jgi:hypothetical protein